MLESDELLEIGFSHMSNQVQLWVDVVWLNDQPLGLRLPEKAPAVACEVDLSLEAKMAVLVREVRALNASIGRTFSDRNLCDRTL